MDGDTTANRKVLIVDDSVLTVLKVEEVLHSKSYPTVHLTTPSGFWAKIDYEQPKLLLIDITMARFDHTEVLRELRQNTNYQDMAVVLFCEMEATKLQQICVDHDVNGYYCKSQDINQLPDFIENFF